VLSYPDPQQYLPGPGYPPAQGEYPPPTGVPPTGAPPTGPPQAGYLPQDATGYPPQGGYAPVPPQGYPPANQPPPSQGYPQQSPPPYIEGKGPVPQQQTSVSVHLKSVYALQNTHVCMGCCAHEYHVLTDTDYKQWQGSYRYASKTLIILCALL